MNIYMQLPDARLLDDICSLINDLHLVMPVAKVFQDLGSNLWSLMHKF